MSTRCYLWGGLTLMALLGASRAHAQDEQAYSALWGKAGEKWDPAGRLPDFSYAGYRMGEAAIPTPPVKADVKSFGAKGDGQSDDTKAFQEALKKTSGGVLFVPAGKYVITDFLELDKSNTVLRGAGPDKTTLFFPKYLNDVKTDWGATTTGQKTSNYSWQGGYVVIRGGSGRKVLGKVAAKAKHGEQVVVLDKAPGVRAGEFVDVRQKDNADNSLAKYLYNGQSDDVSKLNGRTTTSFISRVAAVDGTKLTLERALRTDVDPQWSAEVCEFSPRVTDCGVEDLTFEFPATLYKGEFTELGYNPAAIYGASHCWIRNVRVVNGESGPYLNGAFCTVRGITFDTEAGRTPDKTGCIGHHGITMYGDDNLAEDFVFNVKYVHDLTVEHSAGNVFHRGKGVDICFDHHKRAPHANLFTNLDLGEGKRMYRCGGGADLGKNCAAWGTFWDLRAKAPQKWNANFGPDLMNFVGVETREKPVLDPEGRWWEPIPPAQLYPQDLYEAQLNKRLKKQPAENPPAARKITIPLP